MQLMRTSVQLWCIHFIAFSCYNSFALAGEFASSAIEAGCKEPGYTCLIDANECDKMKLVCCNRMPVEEIGGMNTLRCPMPTPSPTWDKSAEIPAHLTSTESADSESDGIDSKNLQSRTIASLSYTIGPIQASTTEVAQGQPGAEGDNASIGNVENTPNVRSSDSKTPKVLPTVGLICVGALAIVLAVLIKTRRSTESQTPRESYEFEPNDNASSSVPVDYRQSTAESVRPSTAESVRQSKASDSNSFTESQIERQNVVINESALKPMSPSMNTLQSERSTSPFAKQSVRASASGRPNGYVIDEENTSFRL